MDPYAPIRPDQETAIRTLTAPMGRMTRERILRGLLQLSAGEADELLRRLTGQPAAPVAVAPIADRAATRAHNAALRERLDAAYAPRAMQPTGLGQPSLFAGYVGTARTATR